MIQQSTPSQEESILDIWFQASLTAHRFLGTETLNAHKELVRKAYLPKSRTWVYHHNGIITGFISMLDNYIGALFIHPDFQGRGFGKALIDHVKTLFPELTVGVYAHNEMARSFYLRNGFYQTGMELQQETNEWVINMTFKNTDQACS